MDKLHVYLNEVFTGYRNDPAEGDFQRGYFAAMLEVASWSGLEVDKEIKDQASE